MMQRTVPWQMFSGICERIGPTTPAMAAALVIIAVALPAPLDGLRRRSERMRGIRPA